MNSTFSDLSDTPTGEIWYHSFCSHSWCFGLIYDWAKIEDIKIMQDVYLDSLPSVLICHFNPSVFSLGAAQINMTWVTSPSVYAVNGSPFFAAHDHLYT